MPGLARPVQIDGVYALSRWVVRLAIGGCTGYCQGGVQGWLSTAWRLCAQDPAPMSPPPKTKPARLEWLAHTLGHELVHAIIANSCPPEKIDSVAMQSCGGHGPLFQNMNRHIMGKTAAVTYVAGWRRGGRRYYRAHEAKSSGSSSSRWG